MMKIVLVGIICFGIIMILYLWYRYEDEKNSRLLDEIDNQFDALESKLAKYENKNAAIWQSTTLTTKPVIGHKFARWPRYAGRSKK